MKFWMLVLTFFCMSCSTIKYEEPQGGDHSRVRFASDSEGVLVVRAYQNAECEGEQEWMRLRKGFLINSSPKSLGMPLADFHKNAFKEFYVNPADKKVLMFVDSMQIGNTMYSCGVPISLSFLEPNKDYEIKFVGGGYACALEVNEIRLDSSTASRIPMKKYLSNTEKFGENCETMFKKQRLF